MMAIAIVAVIAAVAVPSYTDYVKKTTVAEGLAKMQEVKVTVSQEINALGELPDTIVVYFQDTDPDAKFNMVHWHRGNGRTQGGIIEVEYGPGSGDELNGKRLWLKPTLSGGYITWDCYTHYIASRTIPEHLLPADCTKW